MHGSMLTDGNGGLHDPIICLIGLDICLSLINLDGYVNSSHDTPRTEAFVSLKTCHVYPMRCSERSV